MKTYQKLLLTFAGFAVYVTALVGSDNYPFLIHGDETMIVAPAPPRMPFYDNVAFAYHDIDLPPGEIRLLQPFVMHSFDRVYCHGTIFKAALPVEAAIYGAGQDMLVDGCAFDMDDNMERGIVLLGPTQDFEFRSTAFDNAAK